MSLRKIISGASLCLVFFFSHLIATNAQDSTSDFKPSGKVWGYGFTDFYFKAAGDTATWASRAEYSGVPEEVYAFALRRMYLGYDYNISPRFSTAVLLEGGDGFLTSRGDRTVTIKALNIRWKEIYPHADLLVGQMSTLAFSFISEKVWNYRSIEKTIADQRGIRSSSDLGISLQATFDSIGHYGYNLMFANGSGTRPEELTASGKHKIYSGELYAYLMNRKIVLDLYGDYQTGVNERNVVTLKGFAAFQTSRFTLGAEVVSQTHQHVKADDTNASPFGISVFARGTIVENKLNAFARYDSFDPDSDYRDQDVLLSFNPSAMFRHYEEQFFVAGLDYSPHKNVHIMPNIWVNSYSPKADNDILVARKADIVPRITFYFIYR